MIAGPESPRRQGSRARLGGLRHPGGIAVAAVGGLGASSVVAVQDPVPSWELRLTEWINDVPDPVAIALYPVMQLGSLAGPIVVAVAIGTVARDRVLAVATALVGAVTWFVAKGVKAVVERDRPLSFLPGIDVREGDGTGLGYVSGHSAVAAATAVMTMAVLPRRWRPVAASVAGLVGLARIVHGVHLPADVVGGWSLGALLGLGGLWAVDLIDGRGATAPGPVPRSP